MSPLPPQVFGAIVDRLPIAVFVFRRGRLAYVNSVAEKLVKRLRASYRIELEVMLRDHLAAVSERREMAASRDGGEHGAAVALLTATSGEPFYIHVMLVGTNDDDVAITVRGVGSALDGVRGRYGLSEREAQVAELVLHGYRNGEIAAALGIAPATTKKHLSHIFDKTGVDSRSQLMIRLS